MKVWYKSKTMGIAIVQVLTAIAGYINGSIQSEALWTAVIMSIVLIVNRIYGTDTGIQNSGIQK